MFSYHQQLLAVSNQIRNAVQISGNQQVDGILVRNLSVIAVQVLHDLQEDLLLDTCHIDLCHFALVEARAEQSSEVIATRTQDDLVREELALVGQDERNVRVLGIVECTVHLFLQHCLVIVCVSDIANDLT